MNQQWFDRISVQYLKHRMHDNFPEVIWRQREEIFVKFNEQTTWMVSDIAALTLHYTYKQT